MTEQHLTITATAGFAPGTDLRALAEAVHSSVGGVLDGLPGVTEVGVRTEPGPVAAPRAADLAAIAARAIAATPGPWCTDSTEIYQGTEYRADAFWVGETCRVDDPDAAADAAFIAHARTDVPALLARIAELEAQRERHRLRLIALDNDAQEIRGILSPNGEARKVPMPLGETLAPAVDWLIGRVAELEAQAATARAEALAEAREIALAESKRLDTEMSGDAGYGARAVARLLHAAATADSDNPECIDECPGCEQADAEAGDAR